MRALFEGLFDDAALFPPGNATMAVAVPAHRRLQAVLGTLVGPFVVPAARLDELTAHLGDGPEFGISLIAAIRDLPAVLARITADPRLALSAVEVPVTADDAAANESVLVLDDLLPADVPASVEVPRTDALDLVLDMLAGTRYRAKLRTGGISAELFPTPAEFAATLHACVRRGIAVKCTAGLHSAVRHTDLATGFSHHGFLNVLVAASALASGADPDVAADLLGQTDADALVTSVGTWSPERAARARAIFTSFGTCSVTEPVDDLVSLGLLPSPERTTA